MLYLKRTIELRDYYPVRQIDRWAAQIGQLNFGLRADEAALRVSRLGNLLGVSQLESRYPIRHDVSVIEPS